MLCNTLAADWHRMSEDEQLHLTRAALRFAMHTIAGQADLLAEEMESGFLSDRGGPDALRLLATTLRVSSDDSPGGTGEPCGYDLAGTAPAGYA